ncbi:MAG: ribosomal protein L16 [Ruminococcus sp.]|nr:ribosomal protein L16 [Ruminococcus sp.]
MLMPKRVKYRRVHRGRMTGKALRGNTVTYGQYGLQACEPGWITSNRRRLLPAHERRGLLCRTLLPRHAFLQDGVLPVRAAQAYSTRHCSGR